MKRRKNFKLTLQYDGTGFNGWQIQHPKQRTRKGSVRTVQGGLEKAIGEVFGEDIRVTSSSRTDSGVHALGHVVNFVVVTALDAVSVKKALNGRLPGDVVVSSCQIADDSFNARKDAISKLYRYSIHNFKEREPLESRYSYHFKYPLNVSAMKRAAKPLLGRHDFRAFENSSAARISTVRTVKRLTVSKNGDMVEVAIEADGFLYNMVRNIVGALMEAGKGSLGAEDIKKALRGVSGKRQWQTVPGQGLCLEKVRY